MGACAWAYSSRRHSITASISGNMITWVTIIRPWSPITPAQNSGNATTAGAYMAAHISNVRAQEWPRSSITTAMPIDMLVAMTR